MQVLRPVGPQHGEGPRHGAGEEVAEQVAGRLVRPVQILDDDQEGTPRGQHRQGGVAGGEHLGAVTVAVRLVGVRRGRAEDARALPRVVAEALAARLGTGVREVERMLHHRHGLDAARHLFRVAASLDSQMIGEPQVLGQVKSSHQAARALGTAGRTLEVVLQAAYEAAKRVRSETRIAERPVSIMAAAAHIARDLHGDLAGSGLVLAGTTEMGVALAGHLGGAGMRPAMVLDRNHRQQCQHRCPRCAGRRV